MTPTPTTAPAATTQADKAESGPAARRVAAEHDVDVKQISGTGKEGRITREDVISFVNKTPTQTAATQASAARNSQAIALSNVCL